MLPKPRCDAPHSSEQNALNMMKGHIKSAPNGAGASLSSWPRLRHSHASGQQAQGIEPGAQQGCVWVFGRLPLQSKPPLPEFWEALAKFPTMNCALHFPQPSSGQLILEFQGI